MVGNFLLSHPLSHLASRMSSSLVYSTSLITLSQMGYWLHNSKPCHLPRPKYTWCLLELCREVALLLSLLFWLILFHWLLMEEAHQAVRLVHFCFLSLLISSRLCSDSEIHRLPLLRWLINILTCPKLSLQAYSTVSFCSFGWCQLCPSSCSSLRHLISKLTN